LCWIDVLDVSISNSADKFVAVMSALRPLYRREQVAAKCDVEALPAIRLLMREMEVAVREENYEEAARLRDHPWMRLADDIKMHR
jgi:protein-arginine kinase activator protein McsA